MPIYEYKCEKCGHEFEEIQKFSDPPLKDCPECDGKVKKLISQTSFILKGGGWYKDGYGEKKKSKPPSESKSEAKSSSEKASKPKETKSKTPDKK